MLTASTSCCSPVDSNTAQFSRVAAGLALGDEVCAEVELGDDEARQSDRFGMHPALLDAAFHAWR